MLAPLVLLLTVLSPPPAAASESALEFLYIDANVGSSSGGHAALKLGSRVYHFENDQGYTRLARDGWNRFRYIYNDLENRNIHLAEVPVGAADLERIGDRLGLLFLIQNRHLDFLAALDRDAELLRALREGRPYGMRGVGFFRPGPNRRAYPEELRSAIAGRLGADFAARERSKLAGELAGSGYPLPPPTEETPDEDRYPLYPETYSQRLEDLYSRWLALEVVSEGWRLRDDLLVDAAQNGAPPGGKPLSDAERSWLSVYRERLLESILADVGANSSGRGFPLLLALARFMAVSESLAANRLLLLDALPPVGRAETFGKVAEQSAALGLLLERLQAELPGLRGQVFALAEPDEQAYNRLESRVSQIEEIRRGLATRRPMRYVRRVAPPEGWGLADLPLRLDSGIAGRAEAAARDRAGRFRERIEALYPYDLIRRNCVTELVRAVDSAFPSRREAESALGGYLEPGESLGFVPHRFFDLARWRFRSGKPRVFPSYRNWKLGRFAERGAGWPVYAAEATTWTSSFYERRAGDTLFLLFTEDVFWPRPLYGAVNLAYGLGGAAAGLLAVPFDRGDMLMEGLRGALFSVPELAFGNIRKGSFDGIRERFGEGFEAAGL